MKAQLSLALRVALLSALLPFATAFAEDPPSVTELPCLDRAELLTACGPRGAQGTDAFLLRCLENVRPRAISRRDYASGIFGGEQPSEQQVKTTYWLSHCMLSYVNELEAYRSDLVARLEPLLSDDDTKRPGNGLGPCNPGETQEGCKTRINGAEARGLSDEIQGLNSRLNKLRSALRLHAPDFLFQDHRAFRPWIGRFALGAEYATLNDVPDGKVFPRASLLIYRSSATWQKHQWVPNLYLDILLTSSEKRDLELGGTTAPPTNGDDPEAEQPTRSLEARGGLFWPFVKFGGIPGHEQWLQEEGGLIAEYRIADVDEQETVDRKFYGGLRLASSPQFFVDLLYGKNEGSSADRVELRGQMPVTKLENGTRIHMGIVANLKAEKAAFLKTDPTKRRTEPDLVKIYFTWDVDFDDIFGWFSGSKTKS